MSSTGDTTQGGRGLQFPVESERLSIVDIEGDTNNDHENTYLEINDRENTCFAIEEDSINDHENTYLDIEEDSNNDDDENKSQIRIGSLNAEFESAMRSIGSTGNSTTYLEIEEDNNSINLHIEEDTNSINDQENQTPIRKDSWNAKVIFEWTFVISNFALEFVSTILDQLSSPNNSRYALIGMLISLAAMVICIFELIYKGKKEKVSWRWTKILPWFYHPLPSEVPFGTFKDIIGLICGLSQSIVTIINYLDANKPIKISVWPIIFALGLLCSKLLEKDDLCLLCSKLLEYFSYRSKSHSPKGVHDPIQ